LLEKQKRTFSPKDYRSKVPRPTEPIYLRSTWAV